MRPPASLARDNNNTSILHGIAHGRISNVIFSTSVRMHHFLSVRDWTKIQTGQKVTRSKFPLEYQGAEGESLTQCHI